MDDVSDDLSVVDPAGTYVDRVTIVFRAIDSPVENRDIGPSVVFVANPGAVGALLDIEAIRLELERLARGPSGTRSFLSTQTVGHASWGADGTGASFLLNVGGQVAGHYLINGLKRLGAAIRGVQGGPAEERPITEREAQRWAAVMIAARFDDVDSATLTVREVTLRGSSAAVVHAGPDGSNYRVELELAENMVAFGEVTRTYPT